ncbi:hypothetical protein B2J88_02640 [Rhodococcus sp. SRB_17]|nr:hypothetical protein [Rhodococcus sp. SRB_17]
MLLQIEQSGGLVSVAEYARRMDKSVRTPAASRSWVWRTLQRVGATLRRLMQDRKPSPYSSLSPRRMDGSHTDIFPLNSSGDGTGGGGV